jgi:hypothetical protein
MTDRHSNSFTTSEEGMMRRHDTGVRLIRSTVIFMFKLGTQGFFFVAILLALVIQAEARVQLPSISAVKCDYPPSAQQLETLHQQNPGAVEDCLAMIKDAERQHRPFEFMCDGIGFHCCNEERCVAIGAAKIIKPPLPGRKGQMAPRAPMPPPPVAQ